MKRIEPRDNHCVHESGHVLLALAGGATIREVVARDWTTKDIFGREAWGWVKIVHPHGMTRAEWARHVLAGAVAEHVAHEAGHLKATESYLQGTGGDAKHLKGYSHEELVVLTRETGEVLRRELPLLLALADHLQSRDVPMGHGEVTAFVHRFRRETEEQAVEARVQRTPPLPGPARNRMLRPRHFAPAADIGPRR